MNHLKHNKLNAVLKYHHMNKIFTKFDKTFPEKGCYDNY